MALTRKSLKAMGLTDEQVDSIAEEHGETVRAFKQEIEDLKKQVAEGENAKTELESLKKGDFKAKYEKEHGDFEAYKKQIADEKTKTDKETAVKAYFQGKGITGGNLTLAMMGLKDDVINALSLKDDKIEDTTALDDLIGGVYASLIVKNETKGAETATPPVSGAKKKLTKEEIAAIKDTSERQKAIADNLELYT